MSYSVGNFTDVFFTIESGTGAETPSNVTAIWAQYTDQGGTPLDFGDDESADATSLFGTFNAADAAASRIFSEADVVQSSGMGGVRDGEVSIDVRNLPLPPVGFYYEGWLVGPNGNAVSMGPITTLPPDTVSLFDADINQSLPGVTSTGIRFANLRVLLDPDAIVDSDGEVALSRFVLTLEAKVGVAEKADTDLEEGLLPTAAILERRP